METLILAVKIAMGLSFVIGIFISLRGYLRSLKSEKRDRRSYFIGIFFILLGVGLSMLAEFLSGN